MGDDHFRNVYYSIIRIINMCRIPGLQDLRKKWRNRAIIWLIWLIAMLLTDEYIKEGYFFKLSDIIIPGTHEFLITIAAIILIILSINKRYKNRKNKD